MHACLDPIINIDYSSPMGRPPLKNKPIMVQLSEASIAKIDSLVGTYGRGKFIREAVDREIERRQVHLGEGGAAETGSAK